MEKNKPSFWQLLNALSIQPEDITVSDADTGIRVIGRVNLDNPPKSTKELKARRDAGIKEEVSTCTLCGEPKYTSECACEHGTHNYL